MRLFCCCLMIFTGFMLSAEMTLNENCKLDRFGKKMGIWITSYNDSARESVVFNNRKIPAESRTAADIFVENSHDLLAWKFEKKIKGELLDTSSTPFLYPSNFAHYFKKYKLKKETLDLICYIAMNPKDPEIYSIEEISLVLLNNGLYGCELFYKIDPKSKRLAQGAFLFSKYREMLSSEHKDVPIELINELPNISSPCDVEFLLKIKDNPEYYCDKLLDGKLINDKTFKPFLFFLSKMNFIPERYFPVLKERFTENIKTKKNHDENMIILELLYEKNKGEAIKFLPDIVDCTAAFPRYSEAFLLYYMKISGASDTFAAVFQGKINWKSINLSNILLTYEKLNGDLNNAISLIKEIRENFKTMSWNMNYHFERLLQTYNSLNDENRMVLFKTMPSFMVDVNLNFDKKNLPALRKMLSGSNYTKAYDILLSSFEIDDLPPEVMSKYKAELDRWMKKLEDDNPETRRSGISYIMNKNKPINREAFIKISRVLNDPDDDVVRYAAAIIERNAPRYFPETLELLKSDDPFVVSSVCKIIGNMSLFGATAVPALENLLKNNPEWTVKVAALEALGNIGSKSSIALIETFADNANANVKNVASKTLLKLKPLK